MKVLQIIDTLRPGGAENMAVNLANLLVGHIEGSYVCCTRESGVLAKRLRPEVQLFCLNKRSSLDLKSLFRLKKIVSKNQIQIIHAHSTSYFLSCLLKIICPGVKLIWHDHYGDSESVSKRNGPVLKIWSNCFDGVLVVNAILENWVRENFKVKNIHLLKNFIQLPTAKNNTSDFEFLGNSKSFKIICVANLRPQKNHLILIEAFENIKGSDLSLHLFGGNPESSYSKKVLNKIQNSSKSGQIFYYGVREDITSIIPKADLGILSSRSEGLPLVLLEYALSGLPVICTRVGKNAEVVGDFGKIVAPNNIKALIEAIVDYRENDEKRIKDSLGLKSKVEKEYNPSTIREDLLAFYNCILD